MARVILITGVMAAGKSTVAQALAARLPMSVHLRGDRFSSSIVNGIQRGLADKAGSKAGLFLSSAHAMRNARPTNLPPDWGAMSVPSRPAGTIFGALSATEPSRR